MNPGDLKLLELLTVDEAAGTLHFAHRRLLLFDADAMGLLCQELIETLGLERARRLPLDDTPGDTYGAGC